MQPRWTICTPVRLRPYLLTHIKSLALYAQLVLSQVEKITSDELLFILIVSFLLSLGSGFGISLAEE